MRLPLLESLGQALRVVRENRLRSALGALAMMAAVIALVSISTGLTALDGFARAEAARNLGSDVFTISRVAPRASVGRRELARKQTRNPALRRAEARFLAQFAGGRVTYAPSAQRAVEVASTSGSLEGASVTGTTTEILEMREMGVAQGRFFSADEVERASPVAVIGDEILRACFPTGRALGETVRIEGRAFRVVGVQEPMGQAGGQTQDRYVWIPLTSYERAFGPSANLQVFAKPARAASFEQAEDRARASLRANRRLLPAQTDNFDLVSPTAARGFVSTLSRIVTGAAIPIGLVSLAAAFVVITNTTLVSVTQRTREIGIRRAVGANRATIATEVVAESLVVSLLGAVCGLALLALVLPVLSWLGGLSLAPSPIVVFGSLAAAGFFGVLSGAWPAWRAASADVVTSLRAE